MRKIKSFKLFESLELGKDVFDTLNDIKSIQYILDELGYDIQYHFSFSSGSKRMMVPEVSLNAWIRNDKNSSEYTFIGFDLKISINEKDFKNMYFYKPDNEQCIKLDNDVNRYSLLLKDHLDYVNDITFLSTSELNTTSVGVNFIKIRL